MSKDPLRGSKILLVEDEEMVRELSFRMIKTYGYNVIEAADSARALHFCKEYKKSIHLLLSDVVMPDMSGPKLAKDILSIHPETRVLYMSGYTDNAIVHHGVLEPGTSFIQKPFTPNALARKIREVLDNEQK